jgi:hypothetical protein
VIEFASDKMKTDIKEIRYICSSANLHWNWSLNLYKRPVNASNVVNIVEAMTRNPTSRSLVTHRLCRVLILRVANLSRVSSSEAPKAQRSGEQADDQHHPNHNYGNKGAMRVRDVPYVGAGT